MRRRQAEQARQAALQVTVASVIKDEPTAKDGPIPCPKCGREFKMPGYRMHVRACKK